MQMSSFSSSEDDPAILKLAQWDRLPYNLRPSDLSEASLSPARKLLLLLSYQYEALLFPLTAGFPTSAPVTAQNPTEKVENPCEGSSGAFGSSAFISNVRSFAWGHFVDTYGHPEQSDFTEFLTVCTDNDIIFHAFRFPNGNSQVANCFKENGHFDGNWVEWGPSPDVHTEEQILHSHECEDHFGDIKFSKTILESKSWFCTFLKELDASWCGRKYLARFPTKSLYPESAAVLSFEISYPTLNFLESCNATHPLDDAKQDPETLVSALCNPLLSNNQASLQSRSGPIGSKYKCTSVFSGSLHNLLGLVLTSTDNVSVENELRNRGHVFVVVIMLYHWGMEWMCSINLEKPYHGPGPGSKWADFQFLDSLLVCLSTSGLTCIWCAKTGQPIVSFDVAGSCTVNASVLSRLNQLNTPKTVSSRSESTGSFKSFMVAPYSSLLAFTDDHNVIYVVDADDYITGHLHVRNKIMSLSADSDLAMLANWNVASKQIGCQKVFSDISNNRRLYASDSSKKGLTSDNQSTYFCPGKRVRKFIINNENYLDGYRSGSNILSHRKTELETLHLKEDAFSIPIRRVHLPPDHSINKETICFSPFGVTRLIRYNGTRGEKHCNFFHTDLRVSSIVDDRNSDKCRVQKGYYFKKDVFVGESVGFSFKGLLYVVTQEGLFVILPSIPFPCSTPSVESTRHWKPSITGCSTYEMNALLVVNYSNELWRPWQMEVFDRTLFYEGPDEAEAICLNNRWDLRVARLRRLQLGLSYLKVDAIKESLDMLVDANLSEEGILNLLFTSVYLLFCKVGNDNEVSLASRLLALASRFATKLIRKYGLIENKRDQFLSLRKDFRNSYIWQLQHIHKPCESSNSRRLSEMSLFLEVIRNLQSKLVSKDRRLLLDKTNGRAARNMADGETLPDDSTLPVAANELLSLSTLDSIASQAQKSSLPFNGIEDVATSSTKPSSQVNLNEICVSEADPNASKQLLPSENPKETITRWKVDGLDLKTVVQEALYSGRLPLAVLQLHLQRQGNQVDEKDDHDNFTEVCHIGRAIAYDLFLKGESTLAMETLLKLGEDVEVILRQLLLGTVRRSLRTQIAKEMEFYGYLTKHEGEILEKLSLIERLYPSNKFWSTYCGKQKESSSSSINLELSKIELKFHVYDGFLIECGDIDGVVLGSWINSDDVPAHSAIGEEYAHTGYWACAAAWADAWDPRTIDRVVLDQPVNNGVAVSWESQLEFHLSHNNLEEIHKLFDTIPISLLSEETLKINLSHSVSNDGNDAKFPGYSLYICSSEELEPVGLIFPNIKVFRFSGVYMCSTWIKILLEQELARKFIFIKDYWESTAEFIPLLARAGLIFNASRISFSLQLSDSTLDLDDKKGNEQPHNYTPEALHKLILHYCTQYNLPYFLDLYLDHHDLVLDADTLCSLREVAGDCQWAKWLLCLRVKGCEYEASFFNARSNLSKQIAHASKLNALEVDEIIQTVDDMAEGGGELAALATLMYESAPLQKILCFGSVSRRCTSSSQCTLENLKPGLEKFPTLWRALVSACFGTDSLVPSKSSGKSAFSDYLKSRDSVFSSAGGDTSLLQMLPCWFPKSIRKLVRLFVQGSLGWQSHSSPLTCGASFLYRENNYILNAQIDGINPVSWEAALQKDVEELYSSLEEDGSGMEQHLHRGRALAAFNRLLSLRASKFKDAIEHQEPLRQPNIQSDVQAILSPLSQKEWSLLPSVIQLALMHFDDPVLVTSCTFLLELCGLSASVLRIDIAALQRISGYYTSIRQNSFCDVKPKDNAFHTESHEGDIAYSLARALADTYIHHENLMQLRHKEVHKVSRGKQLLQPLMIVLQHLEKASLPSLEEGKTCGYWLSSGIGDGFEFRSLQKDASRHWKLVTEFCQIHQLPLSTQYLALLANDNDWVGFLMEAQIGLFPADTVIKVAAKGFSNPQLKTHVLTVLKSMTSMRKKHISSLSTSSGSSDIVSLDDSDAMVPVELFGLIAMCEMQKNPGESLLVKAKDLRWSLLAMIASCFPDVSPLSCLTVWLEITAARETSSIKVNDISSKVAESVKAAVEATNALPPGCRSLSFHYNRRIPKRRRLLDPASDGSSSGSSDTVPRSMVSTKVSVSKDYVSNMLETCKILEESKVSTDPDEALTSLTNMVAVLCEQHLFLPLLRAFEMFLPSCSLLPFIRALQAFSQMRLSEAAVHLTSFSSRVKDESLYMLTNIQRDGILKAGWISSTAVKAAEAMLLMCPSAYEKRCLLHLLAVTDFGDGGSTSTYFQRLHWKINLAEPLLRKDDESYLGNEILDDDSLLAALENNGRWDQARNWARQLESSGSSWKYAVHHVTETQAEAMVAEWKEFLWDVPEERAALWTHCHTLFVRYSFPAVQAGLFFLRHADAAENEIPARELHEMLLFALQWLSGYITQIHPVYPLYLLREIETRVWLLAVESEAQAKTENDYNRPSSIQNLVGGNSDGIIDQTATIIEKIDNHVNAKHSISERIGSRESFVQPSRLNLASDCTNPDTMSFNTKSKRRAKNYLALRRPTDMDNNNDFDNSPESPQNQRSNSEVSKCSPVQEENVKFDTSVSGWEEKVRPADMEKAVLSLLEFGQITAAKQLQHKLSPSHVPSELAIVDTALKVASLSSSSCDEGIRESMMDADVLSFIHSLNIPFSNHVNNSLKVLESLAAKCGEGSGRGLCWRIIAVLKAAKTLGLTFYEAFEIRPIELLQLLSLKAQDSLEEARLLVKTHFMPSASIARILADSFLKGLLAAHRGGYIDSQKDEGPAPLLWRFSDFLKWAELCPSEPEIGHALMRLVMTGQEIPHACEVELLILSHHFYKSSACLDGVDVLVTLAANRVESYVSEGDFSCLARLVTGVSNFHSLNFILNILIENDQLELLLNKYSTPDASSSSADYVRGFRMAVLSSLRLFNPSDLDSFAMAYSHFDMKHESASILESRALQHMHWWLSDRERDRQTEGLLEAMHHLIEAAEVYSTIDAGHKTRYACARAVLLSLQIRIPDLTWIELSETNARRALVEQSRFQEALIVAEAYGLNQPSEWAPVLWNQMLRPDWIEEFVEEFVLVLPLQPSMLLELARFYRSEVAARVDQNHFSVWLSPGGLPSEHLGKSFRILLRRTRDFRLRVQLATTATGFEDVIKNCAKVLDKVPDNAGPLILKRGHGGAYVPLM